MREAMKDPESIEAIVGGVMAKRAHIVEAARAADGVTCRICKSAFRKSETPAELRGEIYFQAGTDQQPHQTGICSDCGRKSRMKRVADNLPAYMAKDAAVPPRYVEVPPASDGYAEGSYFITGDVGTGKTYLACQVIARRLLTLKRALFISAPEMIVRVQSLPVEEKDRYQQSVARFPGLLVLDDVAAEKLTDYVKQVYYMILNRRSMDEADTIITTNLGLDEMDAIVGKRQVSRIVEQYRIIALKGPDRRLARAAEGKGKPR